MQQPKSKRTTKALQPPPLMAFQATPSEVIILQAALHHYQQFLSSNPELYKQAAPLIQNFIQRLHDQLPLRKELVEGL